MRPADDDVELTGVPGGTAPEPSPDAADPERCRNCEAMMGASAFCAACGQRADIAIPSIWQLVGESLDELYNLDSRAWQTLIVLFRRPGVLTADFFAGRRARYLPPVRLYLILSLAFFIVSSFGGQDSETRELPSEPFDCALLVEDWSPNSLLRGQILEACERSVADGGRELADRFVNQVPLMLFLVIPVLAVFLKLLYLFAGRKYIEHLYFLLHLHAFFFFTGVLFVALSWLATLIGVLAVPVVFLQIGLTVYGLIYIKRALAEVYGQGRALTVLKYALLLFAYLVAIVLTLLLNAAYTALML